MRVLLTGGGTGGHIFPLLAVAEKLKELAQQKGIIKLEILFLGPKIEESYIKDLLNSAGIKVKKILSGKIRRYFSVANFFDPFKTLLGFFQTLWHLFWFMPDVIFSKGGYGGINPVIVGRIYRIPILIHESDSIAGLANKKLARYAKRIAVSFEKTLSQFPEEKTALIGNPVRSELFNGSAQQAKEIFSLSGEKKVILFMGGSQGASRINNFILTCLPLLIKDFEIIHLCGEKNFELVKKEAEFQLNGKGSYYHLYPILKEDLKHAYAVADLIVSRAGAGSIFEIAALGKPSILIPLPESAQDHQRENAFQYAQTGAAIMMEEINLKPNLFLTNIKQILTDDKVYQQMSQAAKDFARLDAAQKIAEELLNLAGVL